ncbi:MAG: hypothetical protein JW929_16010 [Anaerolineales bacterium]|nr:hypothetical protein [Anaerolineales bacterium]
MIFLTQWNDLGKPPSEAEYVVEYGYVKGKDGKTYKHFSVIEENEGWKNVWLETTEVDEYLAYDEDISTCEIPDILNVKSIVIRCRKLENYSKTYAMAIGKDGRIFEFTGSSTEEIKSAAYLLGLIILININLGILIVVIGYFMERRMEGGSPKSRYFKLPRT